MATRSWHSRGLPAWRIWFLSRLGRLRNIKNLAPGELPFAGGLVLLLSASILWRAMCQKPSAKATATGCKAMQFLLASWLIAGGLAALSLFRGVDLGSGLLLCALCGAAGQLLARPVETLLGTWAGRVACSSKET